MMVSHGIHTAIMFTLATLSLSMASSCSQTTVVQDDVSEAAIAQLPPDQLVWQYVTTGESSKLDALLKSQPELVNITETSYYNTPLHAAALRGDKDIVRVLLDNGADPNAENVDGYIPSELAFSEGYTGLSESMEQAVAAPAESE